MITRQNALHNAVAYNQQMPSRVERFLLAASQAGVIGGVFGYSTESQALVTAVANGLTALGWTVVNDNVALTLTIS